MHVLTPVLEPHPPLLPLLSDVGVNGGKGTIFVYQKNPFSQEWSLSFQGSSNFTFDRVVNDLPSSTFGSVAIRQNDYFGKR